MDINNYTESYKRVLEQIDSIFDTLTEQQQEVFLKNVEDNLKLEEKYIKKIDTLADETIQQIKIVESIQYSNQ